MSENHEILDKINVKALRHRWSGLSTKSRIKLFLVILIICLCVTGLGIMTTSLVVQYFNRQTVVNVQIETIKYNRLPAITLCYPRFLSMKRVVNQFPELREKFDEIQNMSESEAKNKALTQFYESLTLFVENSDLSTEELFELSIPFDFKNNSSVPVIDIKITGIQLHANKSLTEEEVEGIQPIESIVFPFKRQGLKCFTFFHHLNKEIRKYQMDVKLITIEMFHKEEWFPVDIFNLTNTMISFSMHSPNSFPQQMNVNNFLRLKAIKEYELSYNRWKTILLEPPYKTMCRYYRLDDTQGCKMRSDCVNDCIHQELKQKCSDHLDNNSTNCIFRSDALMRKGIKMDKNNNLVKLCPKFSSSPINISFDELMHRLDMKSCINSNINHLNSECETKCQLECLSRFYNYNVKTNIKHPKEWYYKHGNLLTSITIAHNQLPDQTTEHMAEMSFTQFAGNFGGLFGMWVGLSALAILQFLLKLI